jgi:hypothetical protein
LSQEKLTSFTSLGKIMLCLGILVHTPGNDRDYIRGLNPLSWIMIVAYAVMWFIVCLFSENRLQDLFTNSDLEDIRLW